VAAVPGDVSPTPLKTKKKLNVKIILCVINLEEKNAYRILVGKPEGKRPPGRPRRRLVNNTETGLER
jgi:hypothetical protein